MRTILVMLTALVALWGTPASAGHPTAPAAVHVDNDSGQEVDVYVDGAWRGTVRRGDERTFSTLPGKRNVSVKTRPDHVPLFDSKLHLKSGRPSAVRVLPPRTTLTLVNDGHSPVFVSLAGHGPEPFWMLPGARSTLDLSCGRVHVSTQVYTRLGFEHAGSFVVDLRPGLQLTQKVGFTAPPATSHVSFTNFESQTVRVYVAGAEVAVIPPRSTRELDVSAGRHAVTVAPVRGGLLYNGPVTFQPGSRHTVELRGGVRVASSPGYGSYTRDRDRGYGHHGHYRGAVAMR